MRRAIVDKISMDDNTIHYLENDSIFQGFWLLPAYFLEFEGLNTFLLIWLAGMVFFLINIVVIAAIVDSYVYNAWGQIAQKQE
jgi:hypothetical protein